MDCQVLRVNWDRLLEASVCKVFNSHHKNHLKAEAVWEQRGGKYYYFSTMKSSWNESRAECRRKGGDLVKINSREEQRFLEIRVRDKMEAEEDKFWIGLTDSEEEGRWLWADGSPLETWFTFWGQDQPDNDRRQSPDGQDCARMGMRGGADDLKCWFDSLCSLPYKSICEKEAGSGRSLCECV
ncbi:hepatic lectin-like [Leuresthes tenuis]|uniref:hepatic lectin-like n=1 Tax=Leuresthes tenuis TaxID=355514 RepID=UPI003B50DDB1